MLITGKLRVERLEIPIDALPPSLQGVKIVQMSDFHYDGFRLRDRVLNQAIQTCNRLEPDLIVLTGDFITQEVKPIWELVKHLKHLESKRGIYAVLGNHDIWASKPKPGIIDALASVDITVLWNQIAYPLGEGLPIVGLPDYWSREFNPQIIQQLNLNPHTPRIVLSHNPDSADTLARDRVDLQLSGHTHGGQIVIPGLGAVGGYLPLLRRIMPPIVARYVPIFRQNCDRVVKHWEWSEGLHKIGNNRLYVNRGLGTYLPGRFFCPPEVTLIELRVNS
jgi:predicted MPP superfamily phosphohydrolase